MAGWIIHCNYFQMVENTVDQHHLKWLHRTSTTKMWADEGLRSQATEYGIRDTYTRRVGKDRYTTVSHFIMPTMNKTGYHVEGGHPASFAATHPGYEAMRWRVPIDDTHTMHFTVYFAPSVDGKPAVNLPLDSQEEGMVESVPGAYRWDESTGWIAPGDQDRCAQESQGLICDRTTEHLGVSDEGVILLRRLYKEAIEAVQKGLDPLGVIRDPAKNDIVKITPGEYLAS